MKTLKTNFLTIGITVCFCALFAASCSSRGGEVNQNASPQSTTTGGGDNSTGTSGSNMGTSDSTGTNSSNSGSTTTSTGSTN